MKFEKITYKEHKDRYRTRGQEDEQKTNRNDRKNKKQRYFKRYWKRVAVDNRTGDFFIEEFTTKQEAIQRLLDY